MQQTSDVGDVLPEIARHWGWVLAFGVLTAVAGVLVIAWPGETVLIAAIIFGLQLMIVGVFRFVAAFQAPTEHGWVRVLLALLAVLAFIVGIYLLRHPYYSVVILAVLLGIFWMVHGFIELFAAIGYKELPNRGLIAATGVLGIVAGLIVVANPAVSLVFLAWVLGIWLVVLGIGGIVQGLRLRGAGSSRSVPSAGPASATS